MTSQTHATSTGDLTHSTVLKQMKTPAVEYVEVDGEAVVYDCVRNALHLLDPIATVIWLMLEGSATLGEVADELAHEFGQPPADVFRDVLAFAIHLETIDLVERVA